MMKQVSNFFFESFEKFKDKIKEKDINLIFDSDSD